MTTIQQEYLFNVYDELLPLFQVHWRDLGPYREKMPLSPNLKVYAYLETAGELIILTAREDKRLVGYFIAKVGPGLHYSQTIQAITDVPYVLPEVKMRGLVMMRLFHAAEDEFKRRGVGPWFASFKVGSRHEESMNRLLTHVGMKPCDLQWSKWIS